MSTWLLIFTAGCQLWLTCPVASIYPDKAHCQKGQAFVAPAKTKCVPQDKWLRHHKAKL